MRPPSPDTEPQAALHHLLEALPEQVIKGDQEPVVRAVESDRDIEQIDNLDGVIDRQE